MPQTTRAHPFRPIVTTKPPSTRSTETPMDFVYETKPGSSSSSHLSSAINHQQPSQPIIRPLKVIDQNGKQQSGSRPTQASSVSKPSLWQKLRHPLAQTVTDLPRKRLHHETESMDWETLPAPDPPKPNQNLTNSVDSTARIKLSASFSSQSFPSSSSSPPSSSSSSLPQPPLFIPPSSSTSSSDLPPSLRPLGKRIGPESFGLQALHRSVDSEDLEGDSSQDIDSIVLRPSKSMKNLNTTARHQHESRTRTRAQKQLRSKLNQLKFQSDDDDNEDDNEEQDSDVEFLPPRKKNNIVSRVKKPADQSTPRKTTNNYLTFNGWKERPEAGSQQRPNSGRLSKDTPYILLVYLQLLFNSSLVFVALYLVVNLILIIRTDINHKILVHTTQLRHEIELCANNYRSNRCFPVDQRTQFIEKHCIEWEACMSRDPNHISKSRIGAETFAEVMNGFVDMISWKTMLFIFLSIGAGIYATNLAMNNYKSKWEPQRADSGRPESTSPWTARMMFLGRQSETKEVESRTQIEPLTLFGPQKSARNPPAHISSRKHL